MNFMHQLAAQIASLLGVSALSGAVIAWTLLMAFSFAAMKALVRRVEGRRRGGPVRLDGAATEDALWQANAGLRTELDAAKRELSAAGDWRARARQLEQGDGHGLERYTVQGGAYGGGRPPPPPPGRPPRPPPSDRTEPRPCQHREIQPVISGGRVRRFVCGNPRCPAQWPPDAMIYEPGDGDEPVTEQW